MTLFVVVVVAAARLVAAPVVFFGDDGFAFADVVDVVDFDVAFAFVAFAVARVFFVVVFCTRGKLELAWAPTTLLERRSCMSSSFFFFFHKRILICKKRCDAMAIANKKNEV